MMLGRTSESTQRSLMPDPIDTLILDLLQSLAPRPKAYSEVMSAWRTSCPRFPIWEEATDRGFIQRRSEQGEAIVYVTLLGREYLKQHRGAEAAQSEIDE